MFNSNFCWSCLLVQVMKKRKQKEKGIGPIHFGVIFWIFGISGGWGGHKFACGSAFFSRYRFEVLTYFSLCHTMSKRKKRRMKFLKMGCGRLQQIWHLKNRINSLFFCLWSDFGKWWLEVFGWMSFAVLLKKNCNLGWKQPTSNLSNIM